MSDSQRRILELLAKGTLSVTEAEDLLNAIRGTGQADEPSIPLSKTPSFLCVQVEPKSVEGEGGFRMKLPLSLLRAGIQMRALIPKSTRRRVSEELLNRGIEIDPFDLPRDRIGELIRALRDFEIEVDSEKDALRIYLE